MPELELDKPENDHWKQTLLWYFDRWLPVVAGKEFWGEDRRHYKKFDETMNINGTQKAPVTVADEAFGLLVLENCREKWVEIFKFKETHPAGSKIPTSGPEAAKFSAKWTDSKCGSKKYGGWTKALDAFEEFKLALLTIRNNEKANGGPLYQFAMDLMRSAHNITGDSPGTKKRTRKTASPPTAPPPRKLTRLEE